MYSKFLFSLLALGLIVSAQAEAKVYWDQKVGSYSDDRSFDLEDYKGITFLEMMKQVLYPAIEGEEDNQWGRHIQMVEQGRGIELKLAEDVTTLHILYKDDTRDPDEMDRDYNPERSGRSFSAVGTGSRVKYVADASYSHYLRTLEDLVEKGDREKEREIRDFYTAALQIVSNCDPSMVSKLSEEGKRVLADFVAVYVAEQYRHLLGGKGERLGKSHNWDDAHMQVTLLAAFHGGQNKDNGGMFYHGEFTDEVWNQINRIRVDGRTEKACVYWRWWGKRSVPSNIREQRERLEKRSAQLNDYWQFNNECGRSGVNITRRDFSLMGEALTAWELNENTEVVKDLQAELDWRSSNMIKAISQYFISNRAPESVADRADAIVSAAVDFIMATREDASSITIDLKH